MPEKVCPFMSDSQSKVTCIKEECQFYVEDAGQCIANEIVEYLDNINTSLMMK